LPAGVGLQVEGAGLVDADYHLRVARLDVDGPVSISPYRCRIRFFLASKCGSRDCFQSFRG
jgi:hypothetical protein